MSSSVPETDAGIGLPYDRVAITLHWVMAALIVVVGTLGLLHDSWPRSSQAFWINVHALIGLLVWVLILVRLWWRLKHPPPALPPETGLLSRRLSYAAHLLLYLLVFVIPLVGIVTFVWHGLIGIHLLTALWHQFVWHDRLLQRMWPAARSDT